MKSDRESDNGNEAGGDGGDEAASTVEEGESWVPDTEIGHRIHQCAMCDVLVRRSGLVYTMYTPVCGVRRAGTETGHAGARLSRIPSAASASGHGYL
eukprot:2408469-Rhodomonas_salina.1